MKRTTTKSALLMSALSLFLCFAMLMGSTFAWFTDVAESGVNLIAAGNLDIELYNALEGETADSNRIAGLATDPKLFEFESPNLWEPGAVLYENFTVANEGNLALKYQFSVNIGNATGAKNLADVLKVGVVAGGIAAGTTREAALAAVTEWMPFASFYRNGKLLETESDTYGIVIWWEPSANDNDYNMNNGKTDADQLKIEIGVKLTATQLESESDSIDNLYDAGAIISGSGFAPAPTGNVTAAEIEVRDENKTKTASFNVPAGAVAAGATTIQANVTPSDYEGNFTIVAGYEKVVYNIEMIGLKENNDVPVTASLRIPAGLDPATVSAYHYDEAIGGASYDPNTGYVTFKTTDFSPFTLVYDADSKFVAPEIPKDEEGEYLYPTATVTDYDIALTPGYSTEVSWGSFGGFSPDTTVDADPRLEAAFKFACPDYDNATDEVKAVIDAYRHWYCDFFVSLNTDLGANEILLGGNYGSFGWVGFHNGDLTLDANTEIPLLSSVTTNPWTYDSIESFVGEFICGVGDVNDALAGATFTVKLRLINPEMVDTSNSEWWANMSEDAYVDVNVVTHTFPTVVTNAEDLQNAIDNGATEIVLGDDIDLGENGTIIIP